MVCIKLLGRICVVCLSLYLTPFVAIAQVTEFSFSSTPSSWVGQGLTNYKVNPTDGWTFSAETNFTRNFINIDIRDPRPGAPLSNYYWNLRLAAPAGRVLEPGLYEGATRYPFNSSLEPGLALSGNHRGNNTLTGYFKILEVDFGPGDTVNRFAVEFRQYDERNLSSYVDGKLLYQATVPEPSTFAMALGAAMVGVAMIRNRRRSAGQ